MGASAREGIEIGRGTVQYRPAGLETLPAAELVRLLRPRVRLLDPKKVAVNRLQAEDGALQQVHLVNYDFQYEVEHPGRYASDDDTAEARTFFGNADTVLRKRLQVPAPAEVVDPSVQIRAVATAETTADLILTLNGRPAGRVPGAELMRWTWAEVAVEPGLLGVDNLIEVRVEGEVNGQAKWIAVSIDTDAAGGGSEFSTDGGKTFSATDLSPDLRAQTGEYMIRIVDRNPGGERKSPDNLAANGGFEQVTVPHSETRLTVVPATNLRVAMPGAPRPGLLISPEHEPQWIAGQQVDGATVYDIPQVDVYSVLLLGETREALQPHYDTQQRWADWRLPEVTEPLRAVVADWQAWGEGFVTDETVSHTRRRSIRCENAVETDLRGAVQAFDFSSTEEQSYVVTAWSRAENVSGPAHPDYSVYVDATCVDGTVYNGHAAPFATGTHNWEQVTLELNPPAALRSLRLHLLFRKKTGRVWFDDVQMQAVPAG